MKLNRNNYEEYFILYLDNELSPEDRRMVEEFVLDNTDLKAELESLKQIKLAPDDSIVFAGKQSLMFAGPSGVTSSNYEEWLLSSIDNELSEEQAADLDSFLARNPAALNELKALRKAKLTPEPVAFPFKESLYRQQERTRVILFRWKRIAAAAILFVGISTTAVLLMNRQDSTAVDIADKGNKKEIIENNPVRRQEPAEMARVENSTAPVNAEPGKSGSTALKEAKKPMREKLQVVEPKQPEMLVAKTEVEKKQTNNLPEPIENPNVRNDQAMNNVIAQATPNKISSLTNPKGTTEQKSVTSPGVESYNDQEIRAGNTTENPDVILASNDGKKNKLRGIFRKITRTFEKRTNMKATDGDEEDRFRIAGLAIKLN